eukprot:CAMPEP_0171275880 /NCGR_PEP_ID=MMETSP0790-20130122/63550_1 /TAXON_ID=2925 /ORGANISM="Alexandrium catenella, Strain OF101" /LENGTH=45 /DNA_ID= /DNA_START= /DNA_END= /DNA_ORIENTATION=
MAAIGAGRRRSKAAPSRTSSWSCTAGGSRTGPRRSSAASARSAAR